MRTVRLPLLRGALFIIALAAMAFILARGDNPAAATSYDPHLGISVSDPSPGAAADIKIDFSVDAPDSFPNVKTNSSIQFLPRQWGIHNPPAQTADGADIAPPETGAQCFNAVDDDGDGFADDGCPGGIAGSFNALSALGLSGFVPCMFTIPVPFTMLDASTDTSRTTSALDIGGGVHPGGVGYSGQFAADPDTVQTPGDLNLPLRAFNSNEKFSGGGGFLDYSNISVFYRDMDGSGRVSAGDKRLNEAVDYLGAATRYPAGSEVQPDDDDVGKFLEGFPSWWNYRHDNADGNAQMDPGENVYRDRDWNNKVSYGDLRLFTFGQVRNQSVVADYQLPGGVTRYPDFLNQMLPPAVVGDPLARMFGAFNVLDITAVSLNIVTYRPGQLPGYPATLGYPNIVILLNPVAPIETYQINMTSDMCTPLSLTSTNLGVSKDNPATLASEAGYVRLTNPTGPGEKDHKFTLVTTSMPDADDDGIENMLDTCPFNRNFTEFGRTFDPDFDGLDGACDPAESPPPDLGRALVPFNADADEKCYCAGPWAWTGNPAAYRDNDNSLSVTPGDDRLSVRRIAVGGQWHILQPGVVQDSDADYRDPVTHAVLSLGYRFLKSFNANEKHSENVAANGVYDVGEDIYQDNDGSNTVSLGDQRLYYQGEIPDPWAPGSMAQVGYLSPSPRSPALFTPDEDQDNYGNRADNCPLAPNGVQLLGVTYQRVPGFTFWWGITGALIGPDNQADTDGDDIGDACDPDSTPVTGITGHMHVVTLTQKMTFERHGIKLNDVGGPQKVKDSGARTYNVDVSNLSGSDSEDIQVRLRVFGCGTVDGAPGQNTAAVSVAPGGSGTADFTVDWTGCPPGLGPDAYIIEADACHAGDAAPAGFVGSGASCPGASDGKADPNPLDDVYMSMDVEVGTTP